MSLFQPPLSQCFRLKAPAAVSVSAQCCWLHWASQQKSQTSAVSQRARAPLCVVWSKCQQQPHSSRQQNDVRLSSSHSIGEAGPTSTQFSFFVMLPALAVLDTILPSLVVQGTSGIRPECRNTHQQIISSGVSQSHINSMLAEAA